jgi:uncharacterized protein YdeI (YjbR/CyaY-like superfamily)
VTNAFRLGGPYKGNVKSVEEALRFASRERWRKWLEKNHASKNEALLVIYKRAPKNAKFPSRAALEEALCYGWIDGWFKPLDNDRWLIRYTPRRKKSNWSKYNIATAWNLLNENKMTSAGIARLPQDVLQVWKKYKPRATVIVRVTQGRGITFVDGKNYLSKIKMPALAP